MTVHHSEYYGAKDEQPPADSDSPIPVPFLSATGSYLLAIGMPNVNGDAVQLQAWINLAFTLLQKALDEWGIGAKTSSGYGRLNVTEKGRDASSAVASAPQAAQELPTATQKTASNIVDQQQADALIEKINALPDKVVGDRIGIVGQAWLDAQLSEEQKLRVAQALLNRVQSVKQEHIVKRNSWYKSAQELVEGAK